MKNKNSALFIIVFFLLGCFFDHVTTAYGINIPSLAERNPAVLFMMEYGIWHEAEILMTTVIAFCGLLVVRLRTSSTTNLSTKSLAAVGLIRFLAGFQNLIVIANTLI
jgi:hypothetical protein